MADEHHLVAPLGEAPHFAVDLGDQGAGGVDHSESLGIGLVPDSRSYAVGREHQCGSFGHLVELVHEDGAPSAPDPRPRGGCARSAGGRTRAGRTTSRTRSTVWMARSTPAQKDRGPASITRRRPTAAAHCSRTGTAARSADSALAPPDRVRQRPQFTFRGVGDGPHHRGGRRPRLSHERGALHVDRHGALGGQLRPARTADDAIRGGDRPHHRREAPPPQGRSDQRRPIRDRREAGRADR